MKSLLNKEETSEKVLNQNNEKIYIEIKKEITNWPNWKKEAFNINFATSAHSKKIEI